jgi:anti-sigma factor RsiW
MKGTILPLEGLPQHLELQQLLPWYVNGTLEGEELHHVEAHLASCAMCATEVQAERALRARLAPEAGPDSVERGLMALNLQLDREEVPNRREPDHRAQGRWTWRTSWMPLALAAQLLLIIGLVGLLHPWDRTEGTYRTLGTAEASGDQLIVVFRDTASMGETQQVLAAIHGRVVDGFTAGGALVIAVPAGTAGQAAARLRDMAPVRFAESLVLEPR